MMISRDRTIVMWNPSAGSTDAAADVYEQLAAMTHVELREPEGREAAIREMTEVCNAGADVVVAAGGDGTVSSAIEGMMAADRRPPLGVLPLGTGNDLARTLGIPLDPYAALDVLKSCKARPLDAVRLTSTQGARWYANMLTAGNTGRYVEQMTDEIKQRWGPFCYLRGVVSVIWDLQCYRIEVTFDEGRPEVFEALNLFAANGRMSGGGLAVSPEAALDDGLLDVVIVRDGEAGEIANLTTDYLLADYLRHPLIEFRRARKVTIASDPPLPLTADGDQVGTSPVSVEVRPQCLAVVAPSSSTAWSRPPRRTSRQVR